MPLTAKEVFRDFVTDGVPSSGPWQPRKSEIRSLLDSYETLATVSDLLASTEPKAGVGTLRQAAGFLYEEADPSATDHHVTTAGGVKLYVLPIGGEVNIQAFGAVADYNPATKTGTPVDGYFNALIEFCIATGATAVIVGSYYSQGGMTIASPVRIYADCSIYCDNSADAVALEIGTAGVQFSTSGNPNILCLGGRFVLRKIRDADNKPAWWTDVGDASIGSLEHSLVNSIFMGFSVDGFAQNRIWEATDTAYATNENYGCRCTNGRNNIIASIAGTGYVNENKWFGGLVTNSSGPEAGPLALILSLSFMSAGNKPNNNQFIGVNMEDHVSPVVFKTNGIYNWFSGCRFEGLAAGSIIFDVGTTNNRVTHCFGINGRASSPISDLGTNIFDAGKPFYAAADSLGVYQGINITTSPGGGPAQYPIFGAPHHSDRTKLASAVGEVGIGVFRADRQDWPGIWLDAPTNRLYIGAGLDGLFQFLTGSTNKWDIIANAAGASASMGGVVMGGRYDQGHLTLRANSKDYHFWVDGSGNLRAGATATGFKPTSNTAGNVVAATIPDVTGA